LNECAGSQGTGGTNGGGGSSNSGGGSGGSAGFGGLPSFDATCADLEACCPTLGAQQSACEQALAAASGQDLSCAVVFAGLGCE
jgi:hypothetical protein